MTQEKHKTVVISGKWLSPTVASLIRNFDKVHPGEQGDFETVLLEQIQLADREGRVQDSIALKQRLLILRQRR